MGAMAPSDELPLHINILLSSQPVRSRDASNSHPFRTYRFLTIVSAFTQCSLQRDGAADATDAGVSSGAVTNTATRF